MTSRRRPSPVDAMLLGVVVMWALNITISKYLVLHGWGSLTYVVLRYLGGILLFAAITFWRERSLRIARRDLPMVGFAAAMIFLNQWVFAFAVKLTTASTLALILATTPVFVGLLTVALRLDRLANVFWVSAAITFVGVGLVAQGLGGLSGGLAGILASLGVALSWGAYSMSIGSLMERYSALRLSAVVLAIGWVPLAAVGSSQVVSQDYSFGVYSWLAFAYAIAGPLVLTNVLWFTAIDRVGAARATLFVNLQPFFAVAFALVLLSESLAPLQIAGGVLIFAGIALERFSPPVPAQPIE